MLKSIYIVLHIMLILISAFAILILPPKYYTKWYNRKRIINKRHNEIKHYTIWWIFLLIIDILISLIFY